MMETARVLVVAAAANSMAHELLVTETIIRLIEVHISVRHRKAGEKDLFLTGAGRTTPATASDPIMGGGVRLGSRKCGPSAPAFGGFGIDGTPTARPLLIIGSSGGRGCCSARQTPRQFSAARRNQADSDRRSQLWTFRNGARRLSGGQALREGAEPAATLGAGWRRSRRWPPSSGTYMPRLCRWRAPPYLAAATTPDYAISKHFMFRPDTETRERAP